MGKAKRLLIALAAAPMLVAPLSGCSDSGYYDAVHFEDEKGVGGAYDMLIDEYSIGKDGSLSIVFDGGRKAIFSAGKWVLVRKGSCPICDARFYN